MAEKTIAEVGIKDTAVAKESAAIDTAATTAAAATPTLTSQVNDASQADITNEDLFPGMNQKINVGSSSSQTLGTQPIFVAAGQYVPYNILNKKEEAIAAATKKRAERQAKFAPPKPGELTNKLYQGKLNKSFNKNISDVISTAQKMDPDNWDKNLNNPGSEIGRIYAEQLSNFDVLAKESNVIFDRAALVKSQREKGGDTIFSPDTIRMSDEVVDAMGKAGDGGIIDVGYYRDKFNGSYDLDAHLAKNKVVAQMKADISALLIPEHGGITVQETADMTARIKAYAESETDTPAGRYHGDNIIKKQDIIDRLTSMTGLSETKKHKFKPTPTTYDKKGINEEDILKERIRTFKEAQSNPKGEVARSIMQGYTGTPRKKGTVKNVKILDPSDWQKAEDEQFNPLMDVLSAQQVKYNTFGEYHWAGEVKKEVTKAMKDAGLANRFSIKYEGGDKSNIFDIEINPDQYSSDKSKKKISLNIDDPDSIEEFKQIFMGSVYGGTDFQNEAVSVSELADSKGKVFEKERIKVNSPEWVSITNDIANRHAGELINIQGDKVLKGMGYGGEGAGTTTTQQNQQQAPVPQGQPAATTTPSATPKTYQSNDKSTGEMIDYESTSGMADGTGHTNFGFNITDSSGKVIPVKSKEEAVAKFNELYGDRVKEYANPTEQSKAGDFMFNTGTDPKIYELYNFGLENDIDMGISSEERRALKALAKKTNGSYSDKDGKPIALSYKDSKGKMVTVEKPGKKVDNLYKKHLASLSDQDRIDNLDSARDWYYRNVNGGKAYDASHKGRLDLYGGRSQSSIDKHEASWEKYKKTKEYSTRFNKLNKPGVPAGKVEAFIKGRY